jgi:hypothetical protein
MKSKLSVALAATGCALALSIGVAKANTTFEVSGTYDAFDSSKNAFDIPATFMGTITASSTAFIGGDVTTSGAGALGTFNTFLAESASVPASIVLGGSQGDLSLLFSLSLSQLIAAGGGPIEGGSNTGSCIQSPGLLCDAAQNFTGNASLSQTPLPAAFPLFATGVGILGFTGWRRKRRQTQKA